MKRAMRLLDATSELPLQNLNLAHAAIWALVACLVAGLMMPSTETLTSFQRGEIDTDRGHFPQAKQLPQLPIHLEITPTATTSMTATTSYSTDFGTLGDSPKETLSEVMNQSDLFVVAKLLESEMLDKHWQTGKFEIISAPKELDPALGSPNSKLIGKKFQSDFRKEDKKEKLFIAYGSFEESQTQKEWQQISWSNAAPISVDGLKFLNEMVQFDKGVAPVADSESKIDESKLEIERPQKRIKFFWKILEHPDSAISDNAHLEFALTSEKAIKRVRTLFDPKTLIKWLQKDSINSKRRRLYLSLLSHSGNQSDAKFVGDRLTEMAKKDSIYFEELTAWIACYLSLQGDDGIPLVRDLYLKKGIKFHMTYSAISALRHLAYSGGAKVSKPKIVELFRLVLEQPKVADLVISDLAKLKDWDSTDRLMKLFRANLKNEEDWNRVPIVNFLRANPNMVTEGYLEEIMHSHPASIKRAKLLAPEITPSADDAAKDQSTSDSYRIRPERPSKNGFFC